MSEHAVQVVLEHGDECEGCKDMQEVAFAAWSAGSGPAARNQRLVHAILDIDAHATPYGEDEDGYVNGGYLISIGCLHRALGVVGHSAVKCRHCGPEAHGCADKEALVDTAALALEYARKVEAGTASGDDISTLVCHLVVLTQDLPEALNTPQSVFIDLAASGRSAG